MVIDIGNNLRNNAKMKCGDGQYPCIITSFGISDDTMSYAAEIKKVKTAIDAGADIVNDNSLAGNIDANYKKCIDKTSALFGFVAVNCYAKEINAHKMISPYSFIERLIRQMALGADIITLHATVWAEDIYKISNSERIIPNTSRGASLLMKYMRYTGNQNPYYVYYDSILQAAKKYNVTLSLCSASRAASVADYVANNAMYWEEVARIGDLVERAQNAGVNVVVEGIGHCPLNMISESVKRTKGMCHGAPYRVMSVCTDIALGMDHVSSAVSAAAAVAGGADMVTCITRAEHIGLPLLSDIAEAVRYTKLAVHIGYIARSGDFSRDIAMSKERHKKGCGGEISRAIDCETARRELVRHKFSFGEKKCTMCGDNCALKLSDELGEEE